MSVNSAREWMARARNDLDTAVLCANSDPQLSCYLSQQCIEKSLKSTYIYRNVDVPHTHNLKELHGAVPDGWSVSNITQYDFGIISEWVITGRYPSGATLTKKDAMYGINAAQAIHESVNTDMKQYESS